ncbi:NAD-dependent epimerase/dehydratase family protein [Noviherbaspirillum massiliense]|uniref:NAD-dependent epimerase/dehydratase family protein n=1 Tax=Noviherbaspirillum massiliense TaxID=1465823 RepID=UPI00031EEC79
MILVTGAGGFIGMHLAHRLLQDGQQVVGIDNMQATQGPSHGGLQRARLAVLSRHAGFRFAELDLADADSVDELFRSGGFTTVVHLAAQTGVRHPAEHLQRYIMSNLVGFANVLDSCRKHRVSHLVYASSSSIYGANRLMPFSEHHPADHPVSVYAATKRSDELLAHSFSHLYGLPTTGLRFFTVYGPWGRPDMAPMLFADAITQGRPIEVFNEGKMLRDFTYVDDVVESIVRIMRHPANPDPDFDAFHPDPATSHAPYRIYNVGNQQPVALIDFIETLEKELGRKAQMIFRPMQAGDVIATSADSSELAKATGWAPATPLAAGIARFADWYKSYHS